MILALAIIWLLGVPGAFLVLREHGAVYRLVAGLLWLPLIVGATLFASLAEIVVTIADRLDSSECRPPE